MKAKCLAGSRWVPRVGRKQITWFSGKCLSIMPWSSSHKKHHFLSETSHIKSTSTKNKQLKWLVGFCTTCFKCQTETRQNWLHAYLPQKGVLLPPDQLSLQERVTKETVTIAVICYWALSDQNNFLFGIVPFDSHLDQEEAECSGNLQSFSKLENVANTNKEWTWSGATAQPRQGEG